MRNIVMAALLAGIVCLIGCNYSTIKEVYQGAKTVYTDVKGEIIEVAPVVKEDVEAIKELTHE